jgi:hypothetical protein
LPAQQTKHVVFKTFVVTAQFLGKVIGSFLQAAAVSVNWCEMFSIDSLWWSLKAQWQGVGTLQSRWKCISVEAWFAAVDVRP